MTLFERLKEITKVNVLINTSCTTLYIIFDNISARATNHLYDYKSLLQVEKAQYKVHIFDPSICDERNNCSSVKVKKTNTNMIEK